MRARLCDTENRLGTSLNQVLTSCKFTFPKIKPMSSFYSSGFDEIESANVETEAEEQAVEDTAQEEEDFIETSPGTIKKILSNQK